MSGIHPYAPNVFAGSPLDRVDGRRKDAAWVAAALAAEGTRFLPVWRSRNLVGGAEAGAPALAWLEREAVAALLPEVRESQGGGQAGLPWALLGTDEATAWFTLDLSSLDAPPAHGATYEDLRRIGAELPPRDAAILAHARGLMHWRTRHRFCGVCGAACLPQQAGHVMACTGCGTHHFPRTDPAVIMRVTHEDRVLLGHPARFRDRRVFTVLAGFVEPGETLEEAVAREVFEEAAIRVANVRYCSSQPWPFPASIMLGFAADALDSEIRIDPSEIAEAGWFTRAQVRAQDGWVLPPPLSIARRLIEDWLRDGA